MPVLDASAVKKQGLEQYLHSLGAQLLAAYSQLSTTLGAIEATKLKQEIERIEQEMDTVNQQLFLLEHRGNVVESRHQRNYTEDMLLEIDYRKAWNQFRTLYDEYVNREVGGAALVLLPECETMCANLFIRRIYKQLHQGDNYTKVKRVPLEILDHNQLTAIQLLHRLGSYYNYVIPQDKAENLAITQINAHTTALIDKIYDALNARELLLIELTVASTIFDADSFLTWFLNVFWSSLACKLKESNRPNLKCLMIVATDAALPSAEPFRKHYCRAEEFCDENRMKFVSLTFNNWTEEDIRTWLRLYSGIGEQWDETTIYQRASTIYGRSRNGIPVFARNHLADLLIPLALSA